MNKRKILIRRSEVEMDKKRIIVVIGFLLILVGSMIGITYAAFSYTKTGEKVNTITSGQVVMIYTETDNVININNALPTSDEVGMVQLRSGEYFDFNISSTIVGDMHINYEISAKDVTDSSARKIDGRYIKLYLTQLNGASEEPLMSPETYHEETEANDYTGRPAGEMSLYTSSMNSSEDNDYRLRMWVSDEYNPQGDGGGLVFSVRINVYGLSGDVPLPETTRTLLANNPLQEEKENMFNYTASGTYIDNYENWNELTNPEYVTNGLYAMEDEDGTSYYFRGSNVNNFVQFGEYESDYYVYRYVDDWGTYDFVTLDSCQDYDSNCSESNRVLKYSAGTPMYWRIVRVNGDGSLRLIYNGTSTSVEGEDLMIGRSAYNQNVIDPKYTGYTYDRDTNETDSTIKRELEVWYNSILAGTSYDSMITNGRFCSDSSGYQLASAYGFEFYNDRYLYASSERLSQVYATPAYAKANAPTLICPATSESYGGSYRLKVGLITADELVLAGESFGLQGNSYLYPGENNSYWSMTPGGIGDNFDASVWCAVAFFGDVGVYTYKAGARSVINVSADSVFTSGDGSASNPYILS